MACSGRFGVEDGRVVAHATAADDEREPLTEERPSRQPSRRIGWLLMRRAVPAG